MDVLDRLVDYDLWATNQILELCRPLSDAQLDQDFDIGHRTLRETLDHMIFNIEAWTAEIQGQPIQRETDASSIAVLADRHERAQANFANVARRLRDEDRLESTFTDDWGEQMRYGGAIVHVILHSQEHRSEILHIMQRLGLTDLPEIDHGLWDHVSRSAIPT